MAVALVISDRDGATAVRGDALATIGYVANWRFVLAGRSCGALFSAPSPLHHMWSLAIEEQLYLVIPLALVALARGGVRRAAGGFAVLTAGSILVGLALAGGIGDRAYYGADVRAAELLVGVLFAVVLHALPRDPGPLARRVLGPSAALILLWSWTWVDQSDPALYRGGLVVHALLVAVVLWVVQSPGSLSGLLARPSLGADDAARARFRLWNDIVTSAAAVSDRIAVVDLAGHLETIGALDDRSLRPDGTHFTEETSYDMARTWLGDEVAMAADGTAP